MSCVVINRALGKGAKVTEGLVLIVHFRKILRLSGFESGHQFLIHIDTMMTGIVQVHDVADIGKDGPGFPLARLDLTTLPLSLSWHNGSRDGAVLKTARS